MPSSIALPNASVHTISCLDVLEHVRYDAELAKELARIVAPGGRIIVRVPATGPLAGFDSLNLQRYLVDISRRGARPYETAELGWRRHYGESELVAMFDAENLEIVSLKRRGLAIGELATFIAMFLFRWLKPSRDRYRTAKRLIRTVERFERRIVNPFGFSTELILERRREG